MLFFKKKLFLSCLIFTIILTCTNHKVFAVEGEIRERKSCSQSYDERTRRIVDVIFANHKKGGAAEAALHIFFFGGLTLVAATAPFSIVAIFATDYLVNDRVRTDKKIRQALSLAYKIEEGEPIIAALSEDEEKLYRYAHSGNNYVSSVDRAELHEVNLKKKLLEAQIPFDELYSKMKLDEKISKKDFASFLVSKDQEGALCKEYSKAKQRFSGFHFIKRSAIRASLLLRLTASFDDKKIEEAVNI